MLPMVEKGIRGGICHAIHRDAKYIDIERNFAECNLDES